MAQATTLDLEPLLESGLLMPLSCDGELLPLMGTPVVMTGEEGEEMEKLE